MSEPIETQLLVLGGGPGGYAAAFHAADKGIKTVLVNANERPGGTCLMVGCIPSKTLLHTAKLIYEAREASHFGVTYAAPKIDINGVRTSWQRVVETLSKNLLGLCKARKVDYVNGRGTFVDANTVEVNGNRYKFQNAIIATGSNPSRPKAIDIPGNPRVMDSTGALALTDLPAKLLVVGGGYIGLEMGFVYAALGSQVTVVEFTDGLLPGCDRDLVTPLANRLKGVFTRILLKTKVTGLAEARNAIKATLEGEEIGKVEETFDRVLIAVGRYPNSANLGLELAGVQTDNLGFIPVDKQRRTNVPHIFAIGDVSSQPMLAHKATFEGKVVAEVIHGEPAEYDVRAVPAVVFTDPEIAWCGLTETEAAQQNREIKRVRFPWAASGRALSLGRTEGLTKMIIDPETERVLGVGIVGVGAGEMIAEAMLAIEMGASARDVAMTMHPHPTLSETVGEVSELVYGPSTHLMRK
jgi:dihydrolipoamide dehydrogenase